MSSKASATVFRNLQERGHLLKLLARIFARHFPVKMLLMLMDPTA